VEDKVHGAQSRDTVRDLVAAERVQSQVLLLAAVHGAVVPHDVLVGRQQEAAGAACRVADRVPWAGLHHVNDGPDEGPRREVLSRAPLRLCGVLLQQPLVRVSLNIRVEARPVLLVDQVRHEPPELRRILDLVGGLLEDEAQHAALSAQRLERVPVLHLERISVARNQLVPGVRLRNDRRLAVRREGALVRHLQEQQVRELLDVVQVGQAVVTKHASVVPELLYDLLRRHEERVI
jgi:hypothetical protein